MHKFYSSNTFQLFAITIISSLCWLLNSLTVINFRKIDLIKSKPQYNAKNIIGNVYFKDKLLYNIQSESVFEYPNDDKINLRELGIKVYNESANKISYTMISHDGWIDPIKQIGYLGESTVITIANFEPKQVIKFYTKSIDLDMHKNLFKSDEEILAVQNKSSVYAKGFIYQPSKQLLVLTSKVRVVYVK